MQHTSDRLKRATLSKLTFTHCLLNICSNMASRRDIVRGC